MSDSFGDSWVIDSLSQLLSVGSLAGVGLFAEVARSDGISNRGRRVGLSDTAGGGSAGEFSEVGSHVGPELLGSGIRGSAEGVGSGCNGATSDIRYVSDTLNNRYLSREVVTMVGQFGGVGQDHSISQRLEQIPEPVIESDSLDHGVPGARQVGEVVEDFVFGPTGDSSFVEDGSVGLEADDGDLVLVQVDSDTENVAVGCGVHDEPPVTGGNRSLTATRCDSIRINSSNRFSLRQGLGRLSRFGKSLQSSDSTGFSHRRTSTKILHGFTLIELLVVVAIIALLVSILIPSLHEAHEQAVNTVCLSNIHHCGLLVQLYAGDYSGWMFGARPYIPSRGGVAPWSVLVDELEYIDLPADGICNGRPVCCPGVEVVGPKTNYPAEFGEVYGVFVLGGSPSFGFNIWSNPIYRAGDSIPLPHDPARFILLGDSGTWWTSNVQQESRLDEAIWAPGNCPPHLRHLEKGNYLFLDGHAESVGSDQIIADGQFFMYMDEDENIIP